MDYRQHRLDYCQFLLSSQINYTQTYLADHSERYSHDSLNRFLRLDKVTPRTLWENVQGDVVVSEQGYVLFDDVVLDKRYSQAARLVRRQYPLCRAPWSGNEKRVIYGIGVVTCVYVNPETEQFWVIDFRVYDPEGDDQSKLAHLLEMLEHTHERKNLPFKTVLMDSWYASMQVLKRIESLGKIYYCPTKVNRQVDDSDGAQGYRRVDALGWSEHEHIQGKIVHLKKMPKGHRVKLFRLVLSTERTEYVVTNDMSQDDADVVKRHTGIRWKIEQFHREAKQTTGLEGCQCRISRALRNHIACAFLVWTQLKRCAAQLDTTVYGIKFSLLDDYMRQQLKHPSIPIALCA
jgi:hypothetical protein